VENNLESDGAIAPLSKTQEQVPPLHVIAAALADITIVNRQSKIENPNESDPYSPWKIANGFRMGNNG
jgi:hypothetical protein